MRLNQHLLLLIQSFILIWCEQKNIFGKCLSLHAAVSSLPYKQRTHVHTLDRETEDGEDIEDGGEEDVRPNSLLVQQLPPEGEQGVGPRKDGGPKEQLVVGTFLSVG